MKNTIIQKNNKKTKAYKNNTRENYIADKRIHVAQEFKKCKKKPNKPSFQIPETDITPSNPGADVIWQAK